MAIIDVYVIDDNKFDLTMYLDATLTWGDVGIKSIKDMANKLVKLCAKGDRIAELTIVGHGNALGQHIGTDWLSYDSLKSHRAQLVRLTPLFAKSGRAAHVVMGGCRQGRNGGLLLGLSNIWNVPVTGYTALQRPAAPGYEGGKTTCYITCTRQGRTTADKADKVQLKIMQWIRRTF